MFKILFIAFVAVPAGLGLMLMLQPSRHFRWFPNPWMQDTPWSRISMRALGLVVCLFVVMVLSTLLKGTLKSGFAEGFQNNMLLALWVTFFVLWFGGIVTWVLRRFSAIRKLVRTHFEQEKLESPAWERRTSLTVCIVLLSVVAAALFLAAMGFHP